MSDMNEKIKSYVYGIRDVSSAVRNAIIEIDKNIADMQRQDAYSEQYREDYNKRMQSKRKDEISKGLKQTEELTEKYKADVNDYFIPKGEELTGDVSLFTSGISLTHEQLENMVERYKGNQTMTQLIYDYAESHGISMINPGKQVKNDMLHLADVMMSYYRSVVYRPEFSDIWFNDDYVNGIFDDLLVK